MKRGTDMAKKELTPAQYKELQEKKEIKQKAFASSFMSALAILLAVVITFGMVATAYTYSGKLTASAGASAQIQQPAENSDGIQQTPSTPGDSSVSGFGGAESPEGDSDVVEGDTDLSDGDASKGENAPETAEIVAYFNESANRVKTEATKVVKNYEKRIVGKLVVPDILQSMAEDLLKTAMKDDTEPIVYDTKEEIRENFLVPNQDYVSRLTAADVLKATRTDKGENYEIYFKLKDEKNPTAGKGVASVCDVIEAVEVAEKAPPFVKDFSTNYYNCEVTATINKSTGKMTHVIYSTPLTLNITVNMFGTHNANVEFTFVKDFSITY